MKTTLWITSRANQDQHEHGYTVHAADPSPKVDNDRRDLASDFGVPISVDFPDGWGVSDVCGIPTMCMGSNAMRLQWAWRGGKIQAWPQSATYAEAQKHGAVHEFSAPKLADIK